MERKGKKIVSPTKQEDKIERKGKKVLQSIKEAPLKDEEHSKRISAKISSYQAVVNPSQGLFASLQKFKPGKKQIPTSAFKSQIDLLS